MKRSRRRLLAATALAAIFLAGCGSDSSRAPGDQGKAFRVVYDLPTGGEGDYDQIEVLTDGAANVRTTLWKEGKAVGPATVITDAGSGSTAEDDWPRLVVSEGDGTLAAWCVDAKRVGAAQVLGRDVRHYTCRDFGMGLLFQAREILVDEQTGLVLQWACGGCGRPLTASEVDFSAAVPVDAFSPQPTPTPIETQTTPRLPTFTLARIGGGEITSASYEGAPVVIVVGRADEIKALVSRLLPLTDAGTSPKVLGLLDFSAPADLERWKGSILNQEDVKALAASIEAEEGPFDVPVGIAFKGEVVMELGHGTVGASVILVRSDGSVARTAPPSASDSDLASWFHQLS